MEEMGIEELEAYRQELLGRYRTKKESLEFAMDDMDEHFIEQDLEKYRIAIKECRTRIEELRGSEAGADEEA